MFDSWGNPLENIPVWVEPTPTVFTPSKVMSGADGTAQFSVPRLTRIGAVAVAMQVKGKDPLVGSFNLQVTPGPPQQPEFSKIQRHSGEFRDAVVLASGQKSISVIAELLMRLNRPSLYRLPAVD